MDSSIRKVLEANYQNLLDQYRTHEEGLLALQAIIIRDILPSIIDELELSPEATEWAMEWLNDTSSLFRIYRRNNFTRSFTLEAIRKNLVWRFSHLRPSLPSLAFPAIHCLPATALDPFGRPLVAIELVSFQKFTVDVKSSIVQKFEGLRTHLMSLNADTTSPPILQYVVLLDLKGFSYMSLDIELVTWTLREVIPRFPGMLAGVFMLNYSWTHAGTWNIIKRVLPASALNRIFFASQGTLVDYFTPSALPKDYGGDLPSLLHLDNPLQAQTRTPATSPSNASENTAASPSTAHHTSVSPTSGLNPFFGYPVSTSYGPPYLSHGRRRKRDLARTLLYLFWLRWRKQIAFGIITLLCVVAIKARRIRVAVLYRNMPAVWHIFSPLKLFR